MFANSTEICLLESDNDEVVPGESSLMLPGGKCFCNPTARDWMKGIREEKKYECSSSDSDAVYRLRVENEPAGKK